MAPRGGRELEPRVLQDGKWDLTFEGERWRASRLSYYLNVAPIPRTPPSLKEGLVLHHCDHEWCIEPNHLYLGSSSRNAKDKFERHLTVRQDMSRRKLAEWSSLTPDEQVRRIAPMLSTPYERTPEIKAKYAEARRSHWAGLTPKQYAERCRRISEGKRRALV
jgi:hypothetical protein